MRRVAISLVVAGLGPILGLSVGCRSSLPEPKQPFSVTPDASFRAKAPPREPRTSTFAAPTMHELQLDNGLKLVIVPRRDLPLVSVIYANRAGDLRTRSEFRGDAQLAAMVLNEGTQLDDGEVLRHLHVGGLEPDVYWSGEGTAVKFDLLSSHLAAGVELMARVVRYPVFLDAAVADAKVTLLEQQFRTSSQIGFHLRQTVTEGLYGAEHPLARPPTSNRTEFLGRTPAQLRQFHASHYTPSESIVVVVGDVRPSQVKAAVRRHFGDWMPTGTGAGRLVATAPIEMPQRSVAAFAAPVDHALFTFALPLVGVEHPDYLALVLASTQLGGSMASRLDRDVRLHRAAGYSVIASYRARSGSGELLVEGDVRTDDFEDTLHVVRKEIERLQHLSDDEFSSAKNALLSKLVTDASTNSSLASKIADCHVWGVPLEHATTTYQRVLAISAEDFRKAAARHLDPDRLVLSVYGNPAHLRYALKSIGEVQWYRFEKKTSKGEAR